MRILTGALEACHWGVTAQYLSTAHTGSSLNYLLHITTPSLFLSPPEHTQTQNPVHSNGVFLSEVQGSPQQGAAGKALTTPRETTARSGPRCTRQCPALPQESGPAASFLALDERRGPRASSCPQPHAPQPASSCPPFAWAGCAPAPPGGNWELSQGPNSSKQVFTTPAQGLSPRATGQKDACAGAKAGECARAQRARSRPPIRDVKS